MEMGLPDACATVLVFESNSTVLSCWIGPHYLQYSYFYRVVVRSSAPLTLYDWKKQPMTCRLARQRKFAKTIKLNGNTIIDDIQAATGTR